MKIVLDNVVSGFNLSKINDNFQRIQDELNNKVLYRDCPDGETNTVKTGFDMNGTDIVNIGTLGVTKSLAVNGVDLATQVTLAQTAATSASGSATAAQTAQTNATASASNAATSANNAAASAAQALTYAGQATVGQINADWNVTDNTQKAYIFNKPDLTTYLKTDFSNHPTLTVAKGGTGATTLTGLVYGNGTGAFTAATTAQVNALIGYTPYNGTTNPNGYAVGNQAVSTTSAVTFASVTAGTVTNTSDERKKEDWKPLTDEQLSALAKMEKVGTFAWKADGTRSVGGSAQEIQKIVPEAVHVDAEGNLSVNYSGLTFAIVQAMLKKAFA